MIPEGTYRARALEAELGTTSTGKEQVAVSFEILGDGPEAGSRITWWGYFTEKTCEHTIEALNHCGWDGADLSDLSSIDGKREVELVIEHEEYDGKVSARVRYVNRGGGPVLRSPMQANQKKAFAARMKGKVAAVQAKLKAREAGGGRPDARRAPAPPAEEGNPDDASAMFGGDDVPF